MTTNYELVYPLHTAEGLIAFLEAYRSLEESRYTSSNFDLCDLLMDFNDEVDKILTDKQKKIMFMYYSDGYTQTEIGTVFGLSQPTLHGHLNRIIDIVSQHHARGVVVDD